MDARTRGHRPPSSRRVVLGALACVAALLVASAVGAEAAFAQAAPGATPATATPLPTGAGANPPTVLITGSNRGIGLEFARQYAARGWRVIATARRPDEAVELRRIAAAHPGTVALETLDVASPASIDALARRLAGRPVDLLLHNAGIAGPVPEQMLGRMNYDTFRNVLEVNAVGPMKLSESLLPNVLASTQKKIVLIGTSEASFATVDAGRLYWYRASKAAAHMLMLNLAYDVKPKGIAVAVINPGPVDTDMMKGVRMPLQPPSESVRKVSAIIDRLEVANTGKFWDYQGGQLSW